MKKFICISFVALFFAACSNSSSAEVDVFEGAFFTRVTSWLEPGAFEEISLSVPNICCKDCLCGKKPLFGEEAAPILRFYVMTPEGKVVLDKENSSCGYIEEGVFSCYGFVIWEELGQYGFSSDAMESLPETCNIPFFVELNEEEYRRRFPDEVEALIAAGVPEPLELEGCVYELNN
ncbi:MAG: hypothetical protein LBR60_05815 [Fibrobacter sp.]|jgi:hypothetical protein|nr:hypothetical protein [Fibrobacter sp.]